MRVVEGQSIWDDIDGVLVASLPPKFKMPDIDHYMGIGCPRIHLRFYSAVIRAYGLDEMQMIMHFPLSLSGAMQHWYTSLDALCRHTWEDLAHEFLSQYAFNSDIDLSR